MVRKPAALLLIALLMPSVSWAATPEQVARAIQALMPDAPVMVDIARCESGLRQTAADGSVLRGGAGGTMIGVFQFAEAHLAPARALGYDLATLIGNLGYARELYRAQGTTPWVSCVPLAPTGTTTARITKTLTLGTHSPEVLLVRRVLAASGYLAFSSSDTFDLSLVLALARFQCDQGIGCLGSRAPGIGRVSGVTKRTLNVLLADLG